MYGGVGIAEIRDPYNPQMISTLTANRADVIAKSGDYAYTTAEDSFFQVIDVTDPLNPVTVGSFPTAQHSLKNDIDIQGGFAFVCDGYLSVIDVRDPYNPQTLTRLDLSSAMNCAISDRYAYVADYYDLIKVVQLY